MITNLLLAVTIPFVMLAKKLWSLISEFFLHFCALHHQVCPRKDGGVVATLGSAAAAFFVGLPTQLSKVVAPYLGGDVPTVWFPVFGWVLTTAILWFVIVWNECVEGDRRQYLHPPLVRLVARVLLCAQLVAAGYGVHAYFKPDWQPLSPGEVKTLHGTLSRLRDKITSDDACAYFERTYHLPGQRRQRLGESVRFELYTTSPNVEIVWAQASPSEQTSQFKRRTPSAVCTSCRNPVEADTLEITVVIWLLRRNSTILPEPSDFVIDGPRAGLCE